MRHTDLSAGLSIRPARATDRGFLESLYRSTRDDLRLADVEPALIEAVIDQQRDAQAQGYGEAFPDALYFVVEKQGERIGRLVIDFGGSEVRVVDLGFVPAARGLGYGTAVLQGLKQAAAGAHLPLVLTVRSDNLAARQLYLRLGFRVEVAGPPFERMVWYPGRTPS
jgi:ribosomal protein S18 acetylase RimI-like enzyme